MKKKLFLLFFILFHFVQFYAQTVKVDAEIRSRGELRNGFREPLPDSLNASYVNNLRTKLNFVYASEDIKAKLTLLDTRTYGGTNVNKTGNELGILEAWGEYKFSPEFSFAIGRQGLEYDDKRLFSYNNWSNTPGAHDLLLFKYGVSGLTIHLGSAFNNSGDSTQYLSPYTLSYKTLNYIWVSKKFSTLTLSALWVNDSFEKGTTNNVKKMYRNTVGGNIWFTNKTDLFSLHASGYYQFGHNKSNKSLRAYLLSITTQVQLSPKWALQAGSDMYSGSKYDIASNKSNTFNKLYGTNHAFNGSIEYWSSLPNQGLVDLYVGTTTKFSTKFDLNFTFHKFSTTQRISQTERKNIGSEIDITANYVVTKLFSLQGGWSSYFKTKGADVLKNKTDIATHFPQWAYIQLTFKPTFFNKE